MHISCSSYWFSQLKYVFVHLQAGPQCNSFFLHPHLIIAQPYLHPQPLLGDTTLTSTFFIFSGVSLSRWNAGWRLFVHSLPHQQLIPQYDFHFIHPHFIVLQPVLHPHPLVGDASTPCLATIFTWCGYGIWLGELCGKLSGTGRRDWCGVWSGWV